MAERLSDAAMPRALRLGEDAFVEIEGVAGFHDPLGPALLRSHGFAAAGSHDWRRCASFRKCAASPRIARRSGMNTLTTGVGGFVLGVAAARFLDPRAGARRRAEVVQKSVHAAHIAADAAVKSSRDLRNRSRGLWHAIFAPEGPVDDAVLVERVRSRL